MLGYTTETYRTQNYGACYSLLKIYMHTVYSIVGAISPLQDNNICDWICENRP